MSFDLLFAAGPILLLIVLMTMKHALPSYRALPLVALLVYLIALIWFRRDPSLVHASVVLGLLTALTPILIMWGALFLFRAMQETGALDTISSWLRRLSPNRTALAMTIGWSFSFLLEGAGGFGTPVALAAPLLVGLGFPPVKTAIMTLVMNTVPVTFGAVGTPVWFGLSRIPGLSETDILTIGTRSALLHGMASLIIPIVALLFIIPWKELRRSLGFVYLSVAATVLPYVALSLVSYEFPALVGGAIGTVCSALFARLGWGLPKPEGVVALSGTNLVPQATVGELLKASFPLWGTTLLLVFTRLPGIGIKEALGATSPAAHLDLGQLGQLYLSPALVVKLKAIFGTVAGWEHKFLYVPSIVPFALIATVSLMWYRCSFRHFRAVWSDTASKLGKASLALFGALVFVELMMLGGDRAPVQIVGVALAALFGSAWQPFSSLLGALGAFFSGSNTVANLTFGGIQNTMAVNLGLDRLTILALQSTGGAYGHMIAISPVVSVCVMLGLVNKEGEILRAMALPLLVYATIVGLGSFLW